MTAYLKERTMDKDRNICGNCKYYSDTQGRCLRLNVPSTENSSCGHFAKKSEQIDWEQRRYEIAKAALVGFLASPVIEGVDNNPSMGEITERSVMIADVLIIKLKRNIKQEE